MELTNRQHDLSRPVLIFENIEGWRSAPSVKVPRLRLLSGATPIHELEKFSKEIGAGNRITIKREDLTSVAPFYAGNKVRNLEFVLADALVQNAEEVTMLVPMGSNFTATLASQARRVGLRTRLIQFIAQDNEQTRAHYQYALSNGATDFTYSGVLGPVHAALKTMSIFRQPGYLPTGASNHLGALGHFLGTREMVEQHRRLGDRLPDYLFVGVGTCGTVSGILLGLAAAGAPTRVVGIPCADPIVCNRSRIRRLLARTLRFLGCADRDVVEAALARFEFFKPRELGRYGVPSGQALQLGKRFFTLEGIALDYTYTSKVVYGMQQFILRNRLRHQHILYWHTYTDSVFRPLLDTAFEGM